MGLLVACGDSVEPSQSSEVPEVLRQEVFGGNLGGAMGVVATGNTCGQSNDFTPDAGCAFNSNAPNVVYTWTAPSTDVYSFSTEGSVLDTVLEVRTYTSLLGCSDDIFDGVTMSQQSRVTGLHLTAGSTVLVAVDGAYTQCGGYRLTISGSCPGGCNSPPAGGCYQSTGTCSNGTCQYAYKAAGASCNDGNACTTGDYCDGAGHCESDVFTTCNSPPNRCYSSFGTCSSQGGCQYAYRCSASEYCYQGTCCPGPYYASSEASQAGGVDRAEGDPSVAPIYACPAVMEM